MAGALLAACTNTRVEGLPPEEARVEMEAPLDEIVRFEEPLSLIAAGYTDDRTVVFEYRTAGQTFFGEMSSDFKQSIQIQSGWFPVFYLAPLNATELPSLTSRVPVHAADVWMAFRRAVFETMTPMEPNQGVLLNYKDIEFFWYRDTQGTLIGKDLKEKPPGVPITENHRIEAMSESLFPILEQVLHDLGVDDRILAMDTGETGPYARPFVVINLDEREFGFVSLEPFTFGSAPTNIIVKGGKVGDHVVRSYFLEPLNRPFTMTSRLLYFISDSLIDVSRRLYVNRFSYPDLEETPIPPLHTGPGMDLEAWEARLDRIVGDERYAGTIEVLVDGDEYFPRLIESVIEANTQVKMRTYIFDSDDYAVAIADLLKRRSSDIQVQVLVDGLGTLLAQDAAAGTMPEQHMAPLGITVYLKDQSQVELRDQTNPWTAGDHTKTTIIDSEHAYIGGMNIGREYRWEWHDMMMRVEGPIVGYIDREFDKTWAHSAVLGDFKLAAETASTSLPESNDVAHPIRPLLTLPRRSEIYKAQVEAIRNARGYIYLQNAYLSDAVIIHELAEARLRGVDVRVIIPMEGNHGVMNANNVIAANTLLAYGVRVFAYPGMSHIKAAIYDGWACVGSANFDKLSFQVNKEMNLGSSDPAFVGQLIDRVFDPDFEAAEELLQPLPTGWRNTFASIVASQL